MTLLHKSDPLMRKTMPFFDFDNPPIDPIELKNEMIDRMFEEGGVGLAANQIGYEYRAFVMKGANKEESADGNFIQVISSVTLGGTISQGQNWNEIGIIKMENKPIGLLVPNTIVSPAKFYGNSISAGIDWFQGGRFIDPCEAANVQPEQFMVLIKFIDELSKGLDQVAVSDTNYYNIIREALDSFKTDCQNRVDTNLAGDVDIAGYKKYNISLRFPQQPIYPLLQNIYEYDTGGKVAYSTLLKPREELENTISGIILIDPDVPYGIGTVSYTHLTLPTKA